METHSVSQLSLLHPAIRDKAIDAYNEAVKLTPAGVHPYIDQTGRTFAESAKLYEQGRTTPGEIVTNAKAGQSWHNFFLALDFHLIIDGKDSWTVGHNWLVVVSVFRAHGFTSGLDFPGKFKDAPHLEMKCGLTLAKANALYNEKKFIEGTNYILI